MDYCIQVAHHRPPDDKGRRATGNAEVSCRLAQQAGDQRLFRWYVRCHLLRALCVRVVSGLRRGFGPCVIVIDALVIRLRSY